MQDNVVYIMKLTDEFKCIEQAKKEYHENLSKMTKEERLQHFRDKYCMENKLNLEKEINGTTYKVNAYFNKQASESILQKIFRLTKNS